MKMLAKEWKLCMHPMGYLMPLLAVLVLVPGYPYGVCCFYTVLGIFFICLTARENHDAGFTLTLPVSRGDMVRARIMLCVILEVLQLALMGILILIRPVLGADPKNPAGLDAGLAVIGDGLIVYAIFNMIFFPRFYRDINKPGVAFVIAAAAVFAWIVFGVVATYVIDFFKNVLDTADPANMREKALFTLGGLALFLAGTAKSVQSSIKKFEAVDLAL